MNSKIKSKDVDFLFDAILQLKTREECYMLFEDLLMLMTDNSITITNPFAGLNIFNVQGHGYNINDTELWNMFVYKYTKRLVGRPVPPEGKSYIYMNGGAVVKGTINTDTDKLNYLWKWVYNNLIIHIEKVQDNYYRMVQALTAEYNPIDNYNMEELSGSASKVSDTKSNPGTVTVDNGVYPFDQNSGNPKPESKVETSALESTAGFTNSDLTMQWAQGDEFGSTPQGNSVAMSKHVRKGNIGVTTSQQMIDQELKLRADNIIDKFLDDCADTCLLAMWK